MEKAFLGLVCASAVMVSPQARADERTACLDAASRGQSLRDEHKLVEARAALQQCAREGCPDVLQRDCAAWLDAVERNLPTVVLSAKDSGGNDLFDVRVDLDGHLLAAKIGGEALPMDPGPHVVRFELSDGTRVEQHVLIRQGEKNRDIAVVFKRASELAAATAQGPALERTPLGAPAGMDRWKVATYVVGGVGLVLVGVGGVVGLEAVSSKNGARCNAEGYCDPAALSDARRAAAISTFGFAAGGALLAGGVTLFLLAPSSARPNAGVRVRALAGASHAGVELTGRW